MAGDLTISAVLAGPGNPLVGLRILEIYEGGSFALLASLALMLTFLTSVVVLGVMGTVRKRGALVRATAG
jgi:iron(III) transport system permease protein